MKMNDNGVRERSVLDIFISTYGLFIRECPRQYFTMVLLSLLPALISPLKVYLEMLIFEGFGAITENYLLLGNSVYRMILYTAIIQAFYMIVYPLFRCHANYFGSDFETVLQDRMNRKTRRIALQIYEDPKLYQSINLASSTSRELRFMTIMFSSELLLYIFQFVLVVVVLGTFHPLLMLLGIVAILPDIVFKYLQSRESYKSLGQAHPLTIRKNYIYTVLTDLQNQKEVRIQRTAEFFLRKWNESREKHNKIARKLLSKGVCFQSINTFIDYLCTAIIYGVAIWLLFNGEIGVGAFAATLGAVSTLKMNFMRFINLLLFSVDCSMTGKYYYTVMDYPERKGKVSSVKVNSGIELRNVSYEYVSGKPVIKDISFNLQDGQSVAIVGRNGMGKSTFVKLLMGMYQPVEGKLIYGDQIVNEVDEYEIYDNLSAVMQNHAKFHLSIAENVDIAATGVPEPDREKRIQELLSTFAFKADVAEEKQINLEQQLGPEFGGLDLSGGNWQKLAIARALYKKHKVLVFDEATAAIDPLTEEKIYIQTFSMEKEKSKIFITHRLSITRMVDRIIVIDHGRIIEDGTHEELMKKKGVYAEMWNAQAKWYEQYT